MIEDPILFNIALQRWIEVTKDLVELHDKAAERREQPRKQKRDK